MLLILKKILPVLTGLLIISFDIVKIGYFEEFLFFLMWDFKILAVLLILFEFSSALMLVLKKKVYFFTIFLLLLFAFQLFNFSSKTLHVGFFSGCIFLSIEYLLLLIILFNLLALTAFLFSNKKIEIKDKLIYVLQFIIVAGFLLWFEYEFISGSINLKSRQAEEIKKLKNIHAAFNGFEKENSPTLRIFLRDNNFNCQPCIEKLIDFNNFVINNSEVFNKISISVIFLVNFEKDSVYILKSINKLKEIYNIQFPINFYRSKGEIENLQYDFILSDKNDIILIAGNSIIKWYPRIVNILKKLEG